MAAQGQRQAAINRASAKVRSGNQFLRRKGAGMTAAELLAQLQEAGDRPVVLVDVEAGWEAPLDRVAVTEGGVRLVAEKAA